MTSGSTEKNEVKTASPAKILVLVAVVAGILVGGYFTWRWFFPAEVHLPPEVAPVFAEDILDEYAADSGEADSKYSGQRRALVGDWIIKPGRGGRFLVSIKNSDPAKKLQMVCTNFTAPEEMYELGSGTFRCQISGIFQPYDGSGTIKLKDCIFNGLRGE